MDDRLQIEFDAWALRCFRGGHSVDTIAATAAAKFPAESSRRHINAALDRARRLERQQIARDLLPASADGEGRPVPGAAGSPRRPSQVPQKSIHGLGHGHRFVGDGVVAHADDHHG